MRNVLCPDYTKCLDKAVKQKLKGWTCDGCEKRFVHGHLEATDFTPEHLFLWALFREDLYRAYRAREKYEGANFEKSIRPACNQD